MTDQPEHSEPSGRDEDRAYQVLARRFRPVEFSDVVGQDHVVASLSKSLDEGRLPHAFLFCGSRGVGKTTSARILARAANCETGMTSSPCGECASCRSILDGSASDVVELDAASNNGVDEVRALREQAGYAPLKLRKKVFILDEVHMFSRSAFNALLKILEEPPAHVLFVLATTEMHKVPETVRSRCQVLTFRRIHEGDIQERLARIAEKENVAVDPEILAEIAASAMGGLRDAETALERVLPLADGLDVESYRRLIGRLGLTRAAELVEACLAADQAAALHYASEAVETGVDERECLGEVLAVLRLLFLLAVDGPDSVLVEARGEWRERLVGLAGSTSVTHIDAMMQVLVLARDRIRLVDDRRVMLELTLVRLARLADLTSLGELSASPPTSRERPPVEAARPPETAKRRETRRETRSSSRPAPAAEPATSEPVANEPVRFAPGAPGAWERCVDSARTDGKSRLAALLGRARATWSSETQLVLAFPELSKLNRDLISRETTIQYLSELLSSSTGARVAVEIRFADDAEPATAAETTTAPVREEEPVREPASDSPLPPLGKKVQDLFRAKPLDDSAGGARS